MGRTSYRPSYPLSDETSFWFQYSNPLFIWILDFIIHVCFYCSGIEHQKADWLGIHEKICDLLVPLRSQIPFLSSEEERIKRRNDLTIKQVILDCSYLRPKKINCLFPVTPQEKLG